MACADTSTHTVCTCEWPRGGGRSTGGFESYSLLRWLRATHSSFLQLYNDLMTLKPLKLLLKKTLLRGILETHSAYRPSSLSSFIKLSLNIHSVFRNVLVKSDFMAVWQRPQKTRHKLCISCTLDCELKIWKSGPGTEQGQFLLAPPWKLLGLHDTYDTLW